MKPPIALLVLGSSTSITQHERKPLIRVQVTPDASSVELKSDHGKTSRTLDPVNELTTPDCQTRRQFDEAPCLVVKGRCR